MTRFRLRKILVTLLVLFIVVFGFYKFMTYDRSYTWTKEFEEQVTIAFKGTQFSINKIETIEVDKIKLPAERAIKIKMQKGFSKLGLMNYGQEYGEQISLITNNSKETINCKGWCLSDHLIGIEMEYNNVDTATLQLIKGKLEHQFENYKIVWTQI